MATAGLERLPPAMPLPQAADPNKSLRESLHKLGSRLHKPQLFGAPKPDSLLQATAQVQKMQDTFGNFAYMAPSDQVEFSLYAAAKIEKLRKLVDDVEEEYKNAQKDYSLRLIEGEYRPVEMGTMKEAHFDGGRLVDGKKTFAPEVESEGESDGEAASDGGASVAAVEASSLTEDAAVEAQGEQEENEDESDVFDISLVTESTRAVRIPVALAEALDAAGDNLVTTAEFVVLQAFCAGVLGGRFAQVRSIEVPRQLGPVGRAMMTGLEMANPKLSVRCVD